ncbi:low-specificity L-threonine aldolase [Pelagibacterium halotolerans]|uniref:Low-specificity L-threonine aldolase n=1 Tax=Pelagibacterium halotolerans (strain DSM 22347 / JCM 15775 / CGMCC 1.7692 / B2) TaxID=1082931 RepID=G4RGU1_PELHB|nr:low-specificity L-threonine aldolase [Pelagibacterium halotolerans]AEQ52130.1 Low-specificity L-threonine aldolase [Pelagibacterium halotolerans B2]QJR18101.1 low-specificity L-threonine aldolase [Pelagibacterium halotolerans]SDZ84156.1 L-threonine aldolase [Pelagibacterium halotolerans]
MTTRRYDFRSDTVTRPDAGMRAAMAEAPVGDDVYGEDETVAALEARVAELTGKAMGIFVPSGTQSNLIALMSHCGRGDEFIAGQDAHAYKYEAGGAAVLGSIQPQPIENAPDGSLPLDKIAAAVKLDDIHFARSRLLALENTIGGKVLPQSYVGDAVALARRHGLATHLDGARIVNAAVASNRSVRALAEGFDSVSVCLSKGLGAPVGSVLVGDEDFIGKARRLRKMLGGGMRQAGIIAAAGLYALEHNVARLADDHARARRLAEGLARYDALAVDMPQTNIFFLRADSAVAEGFADHMAAAGILVSGRYGQQRWVTHKDIGDEAIEAALDAAEKFFSGR